MDVTQPGGLPRYAHVDIKLAEVTNAKGDLVLLALHEASGLGLGLGRR